MPRPGPRPYECIRRAWHSDSHHPLRGSLIQEIFRVADEVHSPTTRQNKEWQKKLPLVVLRAEEILYSKANSEAEYMDLKTLSSRVEDAVNTMIRRDESAENGQFLKPCVEAALYVGCPPKKTPRSQRHNSRFCAGSSQRLTASSSVPLVGKCNEYDGSSLVIQANSKESRFSNSEYCAGVASSFPSMDHQQYSTVPFRAIPSCLSSVVCTPRIDSTHSTRDATFCFPNPSSAGNITPLGFNQGIPSECNGPSKPQKFLTASQNGLIVHQPNPQTRTEARLLLPVPWPMSSASTGNSLSTSWAVPTSFQPELSNESSIGFYYPERLSTLVPEAPGAHVDSEMRFELPSKVSNNSYCSGFDHGKYMVEMGSSGECNCNTDASCKSFQTSSMNIIRDLSAETDCKTTAENECDLHLRLGPTSNPSSNTVTNGSCDIEDLESSNSRARAQVEDRAVETLKVNDSFGSGSCESNHEFICFSPSFSSGVDVPEAFPKEKGPNVDIYTVRQTAGAEMQSRKRIKYDDGSIISEFDGMSTNQQHDMCDLQMGLGLSLSKINCDVYGMME